MAQPQDIFKKNLDSCCCEKVGGGFDGGAIWEPKSLVPGERLRVPVDQIPDWWLKNVPRGGTQTVAVDGVSRWRYPSHWI